MLPTFILTRTFAISALLFGAFNIVYAAPVPSVIDTVMLYRDCRQPGCMDAVSPSASTAVSAPAGDVIDLRSPAVSDGYTQIDEIVAEPREQSAGSVTVPILFVPVSEPELASQEVLSTGALGAVASSVAPDQPTEATSAVGRSQAGALDVAGNPQHYKRAPSEDSTDSCRQDGCM